MEVSEGLIGRCGLLPGQRSHVEYCFALVFCVLAVFLEKISAEKPRWVKGRDV